MTNPLDTARKILFKAYDAVDTRIHRAWKISIGDSATVTWFVGDKQLLERTFRGRSLPEIIEAVRAEPFAPIGNDYVPRYIRVVQWMTDRSISDVMQDHGMRLVVVDHS